MVSKKFFMATAVCTFIVCGFMLIDSILCTSVCQAKETWRMKYDFYNVEKCEPAVIDKWALDEVVKRSNGKIKVKYYWHGALHKTGEHWAAVRDGLSELTFINFGYYQSQTPISRGVEWSWKKGANHPDVHMKMMNALYDEFPEWQAEYEKENMHVLWFTNWGPALFALKEPKVTIDSIKGVRIRTYGVAADALKKLGAVPMPIAAPEIYTSLQRGVIDGVLMVPCGWVNATKLETQAPHIVESAYGVCGPSAVVMNKKVWDSLPKDLQQIFIDIKKELVDGKWNEVLQQFEQESVDALVSRGAKFYKWDDKEIDKASAIVQPAEIEGWITEMEKLGFKRAKEFQTRASELYKANEPTTFQTPFQYYTEKYGNK